MSRQSLAEQLGVAFDRKPEISETKPHCTLNGKTLQTHNVGALQIHQEKQPTRKKLWDGGAVAVIILLCAKAIDSEYLGKTYLQFTLKVKDGFINGYVHDDKPQRWRGKKITARCEVWEKTLKSGKKFLYIDFYPTDDSPTHKLEIKQTSISPDEGQVAFNVRKPQVGAIVLTSIT
jgi:hypothetical protein